MSLQPPSATVFGDTVENDTNLTESLKVWSCINCRRRKVRCDRRHPCATCTKTKADCVFPVSGRVPRRSRDANHPSLRAHKQAELVGRLRRLEAMVGDLSSQVEYSAVDPQNDDGMAASASTSGLASASPNDTGRPDHEGGTDDQSETEPIPAMHSELRASLEVAKGIEASVSPTGEFGGLEIASNGDLVVGNRFWTVFCKEVEDIFEAVHGSTVTHFDQESNPSQASTDAKQHHTGYYSFLLRNAHRRENLQPLLSQMTFLWQVYQDNVDPFLKVLHRPTITGVIRALIDHHNSLDPNMQALLLAISFAAIMSLGNEEVEFNFNTTKADLLARYRGGTDSALEQTDFLQCPGVTELQALVIYLSVLQYTGETRSAWFLNGVLVRLAVSLELHRDDSHPAKYTTFEIEVRRRLWWQICIIDSRSETAEAAAYKLSDGMFDTQLPTNTNDEDLDSRISTPPVAVEEWTDITVFLIRCEVWKLSCQLQSRRSSSPASPSDNHERLEQFQQSQAMIEDVYLKHHDVNQPLHRFVTASARLFLSKVGFVLRLMEQSNKATGPHHAGTLPGEYLLQTSLCIINYTYELLNESSWSRWSWQIQGREPAWHALRITLSQVLTSHWGPAQEAAWSSAKRSVDSLSEADKKDPRYQQLASLVTAVHQHRTEELLRQTPATSTKAQGDAASMTPLDLSAPLIHVGIGETTGSSWAPETPFLSMSGDLNNDSTCFNGPTQGMDWQAWDETLMDLEDPLEFWNMNGF